MSDLIYHIILKSHIKTITSLEMEFPSVTQEPFIPAFMVRNKLKDLLTMYYGFEKDHKCNSASCFLCLLFGSEGSSCMTRLSVGDGKLLADKNSSRKSVYNITINRYGSVYDISCNTIFEINFLYKIFNNNGDNGKKDTENFKYLLEGFSLLEDDYLGKSGTRGRGKIIFSEHFLHTSKKDFLPAFPEEWNFIRHHGKDVIELVRSKSL